MTPEMAHVRDLVKADMDAAMDDLRLKLYRQMYAVDPSYIPPPPPPWWRRWWRVRQYYWGWRSALLAVYRAALGRPTCDCVDGDDY